MVNRGCRTALSLDSRRLHMLTASPPKGRQTRLLHATGGSSTHVSTVENGILTSLDDSAAGDPIDTPIGVFGQLESISIIKE